MWLSNRRVFLMGGLTTLAGCQFSPVYTDRPDLRGAFEISAPASALGFELTKQLEDRLGRADFAKYDLKTTLSLSSSRNAITPNRVTTRFTVKGVLKYTITPIGKKNVLSKGSVDSFTSYSSTGTTIATSTAQEAAQRRLTVLLADQLVTRIYAIAPDLP